MALLQGHVKAMNSLGTMLDKGEGCVQSYSAAADWYRQAVPRGHVEAKLNLGNLLTHGKGVGAPDHEQANALFREAIDGGSILALDSLGWNYYFGDGVEKDYSTALTYWQRAADQGHAVAARQIGCAYWMGEGGYKVDLQLAKKYTKVSAAQGDSEAIVNLKLMTACAQCGNISAPRVCDGCKNVHYCNQECQLLHWRDPSDPHMAHCCSRRTDASSPKPPTAAKPKSDRLCAACGAHGAKMLCSDCLYEGDAPVRVRYCDAACQQQHWRSPTDPHEARCTGCVPHDAGVTNQQYRADRNAREAELKRAMKEPPA